MMGDAGANSLTSIFLIMFGAVLIGVISSAVYGILVLTIGESWKFLALYAVIAFLALIVIGIAISKAIDYLRKDKITIAGEEEQFPPYRGLVLLLSPGGGKSDEPALRRHLNTAANPALERCWVICTSASKPAYESLKNTYGSRVDLIPETLEDSTSIRSTFFCVKSVIDKALAVDISVEDLIVDVTGGTKMMTAGAALACTERDIAIQYVNQYDSKTGSFLKDGTPPTIHRTSLSPILRELSDSRHGWRDELPDKPTDTTP